MLVLSATGKKTLSNSSPFSPLLLQNSKHHSNLQFNMSYHRSQIETTIESMQTALQTCKTLRELRTSISEQLESLTETLETIMPPNSSILDSSANKNDTAAAATFESKIDSINDTTFDDIWNEVENEIDSIVTNKDQTNKTKIDKADANITNNIEEDTKQANDIDDDATDFVGSYRRLNLASYNYDNNIKCLDRRLVRVVCSSKFENTCYYYCSLVNPDFEFPIFVEIESQYLLNSEIDQRTELSDYNCHTIALDKKELFETSYNFNKIIKTNKKISDKKTIEGLSKVCAKHEKKDITEKELENIKKFKECERYIFQLLSFGYNDYLISIVLKIIADTKGLLLF